MVYQLDADRPTNGTTHTPPALCGLMGGMLNGHHVTAPAQFGFPYLGGAGAQQQLGTNATFFLASGSPPTVVRAVGLITCASVIYYNNVGAAYVHHANAGHVANGNFATAIAALGGVAGNVWVIYAHNNATDDNYRDTLADIVTWGVPTDNVIEIANLRMSMFGINNFGWVGY